MADMAAHASPSWAENWEKLSEHPCGEFWHHKKTKDSGRKDTVAVTELQRIQEPHRGYF